MYDSTTAADIPADAEVVAGYVDGLYAWSQDDWDRFPNARKLKIAITRFNVLADVLDVENGDETPEGAAAWLLARQQQGIGVGTIYCNVSTIDAVRAKVHAFNAATIRAIGLPFNWWAAHYTGEPHIEDGSVATQWTDHGPNGENVDISLCAPGWPA